MNRPRPFLFFGLPAFLAVPVHAQSTVTVNGSATLTSDYRFRGVSQTDRELAVQGGLTATHQSGAYVGTWASNLSGTGSIAGGAVVVSLTAAF